MTEETTSEQLAEIEGDMADIERQVAELVEESQRADYPQPEPQPQAEPEPNAAAIEELRSEVSYVQRLLGESNRKVAQLEDLVASLRTINEAQEKAFEAAGQHNGDLQSRLNAVCSEWVHQAETIRRLQIELDAAQQVPPAIADRFQEGWNQGTARAVETVLEWLEPVRLIDSPNLANETLQHLPQIMRHLVGLDSPEDVD